jgi:hypothetical protein
MKWPIHDHAFRPVMADYRSDQPMFFSEYDYDDRAEETLCLPKQNNGNLQPLRLSFRPLILLLPDNSRRRSEVSDGDASLQPQ